MSQIYLVMNFRGDRAEHHFLTNALKARKNIVRLNGIPHRLRSIVHYKVAGRLLWNILKVIRSLSVSIKLKKNEVCVVLDDTASGVFISIFNQFFGKKNPVVLLNMIDSLSGSKIKGALYKKAFNNMYCSVNNKDLIDVYHQIYGLPKERFFIQEDTIDDWGMRILNQNDTDIEDRGYIFTGGNSYRDWGLYLKVVKSLPQYNFIGVAARPSFPKCELPSNLKMYFDVSYQQFIDLLKHCRIGYIPINVQSQGGQIVAYQLALYHKAVVTTDSYGIKSVIRNGENGILVKMGDEKSSLDAINTLMSNEVLREQYQKMLYKTVTKLTPEHFCNQLFRFAAENNITI